MKILKHQGWHMLFLAVLLIAVCLICQSDQSISSGSLWGINTRTWFILAIAAPIVHQIYVVICWRWELYYRGISKSFGAKGFKLYKIGFAILILLRPVTIILLAVSNAGTLSLNTTYAYILIAVLAIPGIYLFYSVVNYFGMDRAFGIDHFQPEEARNQSFEKRGIFKYTDNGMYVYGFLILWIPGLLWLSKAALLAALFNHLYIWVHFYFTERPDIRTIYRS